MDFKKDFPKDRRLLILCGVQALGIRDRTTGLKDRMAGAMRFLLSDEELKYVDNEMDRFISFMNTSMKDARKNPTTTYWNKIAASKRVSVSSESIKVLINNLPMNLEIASRIWEFIPAERCLPHLAPVQDREISPEHNAEEGPLPSEFLEVIMNDELRNEDN